MPEPSRSIRYVKSEDEELQMDVEYARNRSMEENFINYCDHLTAAFAIAGIDIQNVKVKRVISYSNE